jgi:hypothetical protein
MAHLLTSLELAMLQVLEQGGFSVQEILAEPTRSTAFALNVNFLLDKEDRVDAHLILEKLPSIPILAG